MSGQKKGFPVIPILRIKPMAVKRLDCLVTVK